VQAYPEVERAGGSIARVTSPLPSDPDAAGVLEFVPVGVGAGYCRDGEAQSCYLARTPTRTVCVDLGSGALSVLQAHVAPEDLDLLVVSHLHPDHCVDLLALRVYMSFGPGRGHVLRVLGPPGLKEHLAAFGGDDGWDAFRFETFNPKRGEVDLGDGLALTYREVPHLPPTYATRFDYRGSSVCPGADCADTDLLVCECSFGAESVPTGVPHLNAISAGGIAARARARHVLLTHCPAEFDRADALRAAKTAFPGPIAWARQGIAITLAPQEVAA
jgi:ribonuclease BN (tRNA processing enzyme)